MENQPHNSEEFETWLAEVELANEALRKLTSGEMSIEEFDKREKRRVAWQDREKNLELQKIKDKAEKIRLGTSGKGNNSNYKSFCHFCFTEYENETPKCNRCGKNTISAETRMKELKGKVEEYKEKKSRKTERKHKWDMWQKTKASLWKKTSTNYSKWDYFTSSEEEEEDENKAPILPKNDPNFRALEMDLEKRAEKRRIEMKKCEEIKEKGNAYFKEKEYKKALDKYSEALEIVKDYKALYTNRALCYIKLGKLSKAIEDCDRMLEFTELFEKGYEKSRDVCIKAFLRRAFCWKEKRQFEKALLDLKEAEKLVPDRAKNREIIDLRTEIVLGIEHNEKALEIEKLEEGKSEKNKEKILKFLIDIKKTNGNEKKNDNEKEIINEKNNKKEDTNQKLPLKDEIEAICKILAKNPKYKAFFFEKQGLEKALYLLETDHNCFLLLNVLLEDNSFYQETFLKNKGLDILITKFEILFKKAFEGSSQNFDLIEELLELLITISQTEKTRILMKEDPRFLCFYLDFFEKFVYFHGKETECFSSYLSFLSNLCFGAGASLIRLTISKEKEITRFLTLVLPLYGANMKRNKVVLKENLSNFIVNLCNDEGIRAFLAGNRPFVEILLRNLKAINIKKDNRYIGFLQALLGVLSNLAFQAKNKTLELLETLQLSKPLEKLIEELNPEEKGLQEIFLRILNTLSRLSYNSKTFDFEYFQRNFLSGKFFNAISIDLGYTNHVLRLLARIFAIGELIQGLRENCKADKGLVKGLIEVIKQENEQRFCNGCIVIGNIGEIWGGLEEFREIIGRLINIVKEKTNLMRKNGAILLAKLSKEAGNLEVIRSLHGIELLGNVANIILNK